jgi:hypothetical protein
MAIFDTDFDKYVEDVLTLFKRVESAGVIPLFAYMEGFPEDWKENPAAFVKWAREVHVHLSPNMRSIRIPPAWRLSRRWVKQAHSQV